MREYLNSIISTVIVCQIAVMFSPSGDGVRKYVRLICTLSVILTLISPVRGFIGDADSIIYSIGEFFAGEASLDTPGMEIPHAEEELEQFAYVVMRTVSDNFGVKSENIRLTLVTNDESEVEELQLYLAETAHSDRERIRISLEEELGISVYVFSER